MASLLPDTDSEDELPNGYLFFMFLTLVQILTKSYKIVIKFIGIVGNKG